METALNLQDDLPLVGSSGPLAPTSEILAIFAQDFCLLFQISSYEYLF